MKCFYHHDHDAVGLCKSCQKGLCPDCTTDLSRGLACRLRCEEDVEKLIQLIQNNIQLAPTSTRFIKAARRSGLIASSFNIVIGGMLTGWGLMNHISLLVAMGGCIVLFGLISFVRSLRLASTRNT